MQTASRNRAIPERIGQFFDIALRNLDHVVGRGTVDVEERLVPGDQFDHGGARRELRDCLKKGRIELKSGDPLGGLPAEIVHANRADEANIMPQPSRVNTKVQWRSSQWAGLRKYVPKDLTDGDDTRSAHNL